MESVDLTINTYRKIFLCKSTHLVLDRVHSSLQMPSLDPMTNFPKNNSAVDTYRIIKEIGRGGMARIFEAEHTITRAMCPQNISPQ